MAVPVNKPRGKGPLHPKASNFCHLHWGGAEENRLSFLTYLSLRAPLGHGSGNDSVALPHPLSRAFFLRAVGMEEDKLHSLHNVCKEKRVEMILEEELEFTNHNNCSLSSSV